MRSQYTVATGAGAGRRVGEGPAQGPFVAVDGGDVVWL